MKKINKFIILNDFHLIPHLLLKVSILHNDILFTQYTEPSFQLPEKFVVLITMKPNFNKVFIKFD